LLRPEDGASMKTMPSAGQPATLAASKRRSQTPSLDQRMKVWAAEGLGGHPPWAQLGGDGAPLGAVLHAPDNRFNSPAQVREFAPGLGSHSLDQRLDRAPLDIGEDRHGVAPAVV
jgi:hypothetical protein